MLTFQRAITLRIWRFGPSAVSVWSSQPWLQHYDKSFCQNLKTLRIEGKKCWRLEGLKAWRLEDYVVACGPISLNVIPDRFWRPIVFHFCTVNFVATKWDWWPTWSCGSHWWGPFAGHHGFEFRSHLSDGSARGRTVPFYPSDIVVSYHLTFTLTP